MNELSILMHLLSRRINKYQLGATEEEICNLLNISRKYQASLFNQLILNLSSYIEILGLNIKYNSLDSHWYISYESELCDIVKANPFENKPRLAASLLTVLVSCFSNHGTSTVSEIAKLRKKKGILSDLRELEKMGYINLDSGSGKVLITPLIGYQLDIDQLLINLALKLKEEDDTD
jgi:hypothetical protein